MIAPREADEEAGVEHEAPIRELARVSMENDIRTLKEVELSLHRLKIGKYGRCGSCGGKIPPTRLMAIPWIHVCVDCAGGGFRQQKRALEQDLECKSAADLDRVIQFQKSR